MWAIIGGSGFEKFDGFEAVEDLNTKTPYGDASSGFKKVRIAGQEALFVSRHGSKHEHLPSEVNYAANIYALKMNGAKAVLSFSAIGSLQKDLAPGDMVVPTQYIDRTKGIRRHTFCGDGDVGHVSLAEPVCRPAVDRLKELVTDFDFKSHFGKTYICIEGPYFSTRAESAMYRQFGADIIGMTNFPEYALAREAGLSYVPCCFVTDYDCWDDTIPHVTVEQVLEIMKNNNAKAFQVAEKVIGLGDHLIADAECENQGLKTGLFSPRETASSAIKALL